MAEGRRDGRAVVGGAESFPDPRPNAGRAGTPPASAWAWCRPVRTLVVPPYSLNNGSMTGRQCYGGRYVAGTDPSALRGLSAAMTRTQEPNEGPLLGPRSPANRTPFTQVTPAECRCARGRIRKHQLGYAGLASNAVESSTRPEATAGQ